MDLAALAGGFAAALRDEGVDVTPAQAARLVRAVRVAAPATVDELYLVARPTLLVAREQRPAFDRVFDRIFRPAWVDPASSRGDAAAPRPPTPTTVRPAPPAPAPRRPVRPAASAVKPDGARTTASAGRSHDDAPGRESAALLSPSSEERLARTDFALLAPEELEELRHRFRSLALALPVRRSRRRSPRRGREHVDLRATLAAGRRTGGDPVEVVRRDRRRRPRRIVFLCDISGSMEPYASAYVHWLHAVEAAARAEVFSFATRLTRLTPVLRAGDASAALAAAGEAAPDWHGGTRIGDSIAAFLDRYGRRGLARGAVVVVVSDGWERDDPAGLAEQMARLGRLAHSVVWVNPRRADPRYEPLAGGMAAALPHVDAFVSGHDVAALGELVQAIRGASPAARALSSRPVAPRRDPPRAPRPPGT